MSTTPATPAGHICVCNPGVVLRRPAQAQAERVGVLIRAQVPLVLLPSPAAPEVWYFAPAWTEHFHSVSSLKRAARDVVWREAVMAVKAAKREAMTRNARGW